MRELNNQLRIGRAHREDRTNQFETSPNAFKTVDQITDASAEEIVEGEPLIDSTNNRILVKHFGVLTELIVEDNKVKLQEITNG